MISTPALGSAQYSSGPPAYMTPPPLSASSMDRRSSLDPAAYAGLTALHVGTPGYASTTSAYSSPASFHHSSHSRQSSEASFHGAPSYAAPRRMSNALDSLQAAANVPLPPSPLVLPSAPPMGLGFHAGPSYSYEPLSYAQQAYSDVRMADGGPIKTESP